MEKPNPRRFGRLQTLSTLLGSLGLLACTATLGPDGTGSHAGGASAGTVGTGGQTTMTPAIGQGVVRRISRTEYNNTVRDLLGTARRLGRSMSVLDYVAEERASLLTNPTLTTASCRAG